MLTISPTASEAIRRLVETTELPPSTGIRIAAGPQTDQGTPLELALVENPMAEDQVVAEDGASVFVEAQVAAELDDMVLDATVSDDEVAFVLRQERGPSPPGVNGADPS